MSADKTFLNCIENISNGIKIKNNDYGYENLCTALNLQIVKTSICVPEFEELCEAFIPLLYFGLVYPKPERQKFISTLIGNFLDKWFVAYDNHDLNQLVISIDPQYCNLSFASVLLLYNFYELKLKAESAQILLHWRSSNNPPLQWLKETLSCRENAHKNFVTILYKSIYYKECKEEFEFDNCYLKAYSLFLNSCASYATGNYDRSLEILDAIDLKHCSLLLRGWVSTFKGLNLEYLDKKQSALMEYRESLCNSADCFYSLYYSSRIFKKSSMIEADLEVLELITTVKPDKFTADSSLQTTLLRYHFPVPSELHLKALWLLASSQHSCQNWSYTRKIYFSMLNKWDENAIEASLKNGQRPSLLLPQDRLPDLPPVTCVRMGYISSLLFMRNFDEVDAQINELGDLEGSPNENFGQLSNREKLLKFSNTLSHLMVAESMYQQHRFEDSLTVCSKIIISVELMHCEMEPWKMMILLTKNYLYKLLTLLYESNELNMRENTLHFKRLHHCASEMLTQTSEVTLDGDVTFKTVFKNAEMDLKARIQELNKE